MSPVSRKRKKVKDKAKARRSRAPQPQNHGAFTPAYNPNRPRGGGPQPPPEVELLARLSDAWQILAKNNPATHCLHAIHGISTVLADWGVDSEPVVVRATVEWPEATVDVGSRTPSVTGTGTRLEWTGHMGLWIPLLGRFMDPTLYQANRPGMSDRIDRGIVIPIHPRDLGPVPFDTVYSAIVTYHYIDLPGRDILQELPPHVRSEMQKSTSIFSHEMTQLMRRPELADLRSRLTVEPLASSVAAI